jgi:hypothetical protein
MLMHSADYDRKCIFTRSRFATVCNRSDRAPATTNTRSKPSKSLGSGGFVLLGVRGLFDFH